MLLLDLVKIGFMARCIYIISLTVLMVVHTALAGEPRFIHPGGLHTPAQLKNIREQMQTEPVKQACEVLFATAQTYLDHKPHPPANYNVPYYYMNKKACMSAKKTLSDDAFAAYTLALAYQLSDKEAANEYALAAAKILNSWATRNKKISGFDGNLVACYCGVPLIAAAELISDYPGWNGRQRQVFRRWLSDTIAQSANSIKHKNNNQGCWGLYASLACNHFLEDAAGFKSDTKLLKKHISSMINDTGELPAENKRTNSGIWYTYFALCPMSCSAAIVTNTTGENMFEFTDSRGRGLKLALDRLFEYCRQPQSWPYEKPKGLTGILHNLFYPSADQLKLPRADSWPGNLYEVMNGIYDEPAWDQWLKPHRPIQSGRGWSWASVSAAGYPVR